MRWGRLLRLAHAQVRCYKQESHNNASGISALIFIILDSTRNDQSNLTRSVSKWPWQMVNNMAAALLWLYWHPSMTQKLTATGMNAEASTACCEMARLGSCHRYKRAMGEW